MRYTWRNCFEVSIKYNFRLEIFVSKKSIKTHRMSLLGQKNQLATLLLVEIGKAQAVSGLQKLHSAEL
jgi:hypothetical protein